jgi:predicted acetyltransferase
MLLSSRFLRPAGSPQRRSAFRSAAGAAESGRQPPVQQQELPFVKTLIRRAVAEDLPAIAVADGRGFGLHYSEQDLDDFRPLFEPERYLLACEPDDGVILGVAGSFSFEVTMPGGAALPTQGVTWVSVATTHRRRGILRDLMREQHQGFAEEGLALSLLTASEGGIYGRFGYGQAGRSRTVQVQRRLVRFRRDAPGLGGVRLVDAAEARVRAPEVHRRWAALTPGAVSRDDRWWDCLLLDRPDHRDGATGLFHLLHADGYASYRIHHADSTCRVVDVFAATDEAHGALWRTLLGLDLMDTVTSDSCPVDDPLPFLLEDTRQVRTSGMADGLWARVLDVTAVLEARRYPVEIDVVLDVTDPFLELGGRFRLRGGPDGAHCERVTATPDAHLEIGTLGTLVFGVHRAHTLARAKLIGAEPSVLGQLDTAMAGEREVRHGTSF